MRTPFESKNCSPAMANSASATMALAVDMEIAVAQVVAQTGVVQDLVERFGPGSVAQIDRDGAAHVVADDDAKIRQFAEGVDDVAHVGVLEIERDRVRLRLRGRTAQPDGLDDVAVAKNAQPRLGLAVIVRGQCDVQPVAALPADDL